MLDILFPRGFKAAFTDTLLDRVTVSDTATDGQRMVGLGNVRNWVWLLYDDAQVIDNLALAPRKGARECG